MLHRAVSPSFLPELFVRSNPLVLVHQSNSMHQKITREHIGNSMQKSTALFWFIHTLEREFELGDKM